MNNHRYSIALAIYGTPILCFIMRRIAYARADLLVFLAITIMGTCAIFVTLRIPGLYRTMRPIIAARRRLLVFLPAVFMRQKNRPWREYVGNVQGHLYYDETSSGAYLKSLNDSYKKGEAIPYGVTRLSYHHIAYIVPACGIMLGRALGLTVCIYLLRWENGSPVHAMRFSRGSNASCQKGKGSICGGWHDSIHGLLASAYNHDYWIVGWTLLGFAKYLALYENDEPITTRQLADIIVTIIIGILPKHRIFPITFFRYYSCQRSV